MKKLLLHIGMHKTGTSSLQTTLFDSRETLSNAGITYLDIEDNHSAAFYSLFCDAPEKYHVNRRRGIHTKEQAATHNRTLRKRLTDKLAATDSSITIISGEDLSLLPKAKVPELQRFLASFFDDVRVIGYARPPISFVNSLAQQSLKGGATMEHLTTHPPSPTYQWRFQKFLDAFGKDKVTLRQFTRDALLNGCIVADFLNTAELPDHLYSTLKISRRNNSLSVLAGTLLARLNAQIPVFVGDALNPARKAGATVLLQTLPGDAFRLPDSVVEQALAESDWDIRWMKAQLEQNGFAAGFDDRARLKEFTHTDVPGYSETELDALARLVHDLAPTEGSSQR